MSLATAFARRARVKSSGGEVKRLASCGARLDAPRISEQNEAAEPSRFKAIRRAKLTKTCSTRPSRRPSSVGGQSRADGSLCGGQVGFRA